MHREEAAAVVFAELLLIPEAENNALPERRQTNVKSRLELSWNQKGDAFFNGCEDKGKWFTESL